MASCALSVKPAKSKKNVIKIALIMSTLIIMNLKKKWKMDKIVLMQLNRLKYFLKFEYNCLKLKSNEEICTNSKLCSKV